MNALAKLSNATKMLAEVRSAHDAQKIMNMAAAAEYYAKKAKLGEEAISYAHAIKVDAERLLGGFLKETPKASGSLRRGTHKEPRADTPTLADLGLTKKQSAASQLLHTIAEEAPEEFAAIRSGKKSVSRVRHSIQRAKAITKAQLPSGKFRVIYADPPWKYNDSCADGAVQAGGASTHYPAMSISELCSLPGKNILD